MGLHHNNFTGKKPLLNGLVDPAPSKASVVPNPAPAPEVGVEVDTEVEKRHEVRVEGT